jgi:hypothetical protein
MKLIFSIITFISLFAMTAFMKLGEQADLASGKKIEGKPLTKHEAWLIKNEGLINLISLLSIGFLGCSMLIDGILLVNFSNSLLLSIIGWIILLTGAISIAIIVIGTLYCLAVNWLSKTKKSVR